MKVCPVNENSVMVYFADTVSPETADKIAGFLPVLKQDLGQCLIDVVPSYTSVLISFDLMTISLRELLQQLNDTLGKVADAQQNQATAPLIELPVYYGSEVALDAEEVCTYSGLSFEQVVEIHSAALYRVYAIGFTPGFAYLGNTDERIAIPRRKTPRLQVPAGSLAIADQQTAIYPKQSPGGWQIIGRTPVSLIDYQRENLTLFEMGARVKFIPIDKAEFLAMGGTIQDEEIQPSSLEAE